MNQSERFRLIVTSGEPAGIGPDICLALLDAGIDADVVVLADHDLLTSRAQALGVNFSAVAFDAAVHVPASVLHCPLSVPARAGTPNDANAPALVAMLERAAQLVATGTGDALVTAPVAKAVLASVRPDFRGHTEFLAQLAGSGETVMAMVSTRIRLALATTHLPLAAVPAALTVKHLERVLSLADAGMYTVLGGVQPRWLVCGLNPHAGEDGLLGSEEREVIAPAIANARAAGMEIEGPVPADTAFLPERLGARTCVLAMYHDQGLPVVKHDDFAGTVNVTFGLPYVRTSVDHGTAFALAGTGKADSASLFSAAQLAITLVKQRRTAV